LATAAGQAVLEELRARPSLSTFAKVCRLAGQQPGDAADRAGLRAQLVKLAVQLGLDRSSIQGTLDATLPGSDVALDDADGSNAAIDPLGEPTPPSEVLIVSTPEVARHDVVRTFGLVVGSCVQTRHVGSRVAASVQEVVGGELHGLTRLLDDARAEALARLAIAASEVGANAVVGAGMSTSEVWAGAAEISLFGTAVRIQPSR
jgi:uncharacterized protein YbjQ (UPF0145 family)